MVPRRAPSPDQRQRDADRTRRALLEAALREFADKGLAGARTSEIAERAGVNKQLISYYFGGKQGLYDAIVEQWLAQEREMADPDTPLDELVCRYLAVTRQQPDLQRLFLREHLEGDQGAVEPDLDGEDLTEFRRRQAAGELAPELDPGFVLIVLQAMVSVGTLFPREVQRLLGLDPTSDEYFTLAEAQLRAIVRRLADDPS